MPRNALRLFLAAAFLPLVACNDNQPVGVLPGRVAAAVVTPVGTLDQNISSLLGLFTGNGALAQWKNVKRKYADGQSDPQQLVVCKTMLVNLVDWVNKHSSEMSTPPAGETKEAAAARVILYMSEYVYNGPTFTPPAYTPAADVAVSIVTPAAGDTIVTPAEVAGIGLESGSVAEPTIIVVTQNPTPYPANCSGPLQTKLCQYPRFYTFDQFPHVKLLKQAKISVCHLGGDSDRAPLADHDRFRLAHTLPANAADYTPGSTIRNTGGEAVEILPLITQSFVNCGNVEMTASGLRHTGGPLTRLARVIAKFFAPATAYAIDQGFGGGTMEFSDFNDVDPDGAPDKSVEATFTGPYYQTGTASVTYKVKNTGTATSGPVPVAIRISTDTAFDVGDPTLATASLPPIVPGDSATQTVSFVIPAGVTLGSQFIGVQVADDSTLAEPDLTNNKNGSWVTVEPAVEKEVTFFQASAGPYHAGDHVSVNFRTKNNGAASAASVPVKLIISPDTVFDPSDITVATAPSAVVPGHDSVGQVIAFVIPPTVGIGSRFMGIEMGDDPIHPEGNLGNNKAGVFASFQPPFLSVASRMDVGDASVCALNSSNVNYCWGTNQQRQFGSVADGANHPSPLVAATPSFVAIAAGRAPHFCGIAVTQLATCWGRNSFGEIGGGTVTGTSGPTAVAGGFQWLSINTARLTTCGVRNTGQGYCWGANQRGEIGSTAVPLPTPFVPGPPASGGVVTSTPTPHLIDGGLSWSSVVPGWLHTCGLTNTGLAYCWGDNAAGQLGIGTVDTVAHRTPTPVAGGLHFIQLSLGTRSTCGITPTHQAFCWGENPTGQAGIGVASPAVSVPTAVVGGLKFSYISVSSGFGDGVQPPLPVGPSPGINGQGGYGFTCALSERGAAFCWGWNQNGSLGDGTTINSAAPVPVAGSNIFTAIYAGGGSACAKWLNSIQCWGGNLYGQLGNGTLLNVATPTLVANPFDVP